jgi:acyl-CoA synthetase (AMP-forming)/AMP-acid ligase II
MAVLLAQRIPAHGMVGILASNGLMSLPLGFACTKARLVRVPLNARLSASEHETMVRRASVGLLVYSTDQAERTHALRKAVPDLELLSLDQFTKDASGLAGTFPDPSPDDPVLAVFTSGTTGRLKAVVHSQASYGAVALNVLGNLIDPRPGDAMLHAASLFHASGTLLPPYWLRGGAAAVLAQFEPRELYGCDRAMAPYGAHACTDHARHAARSSFLRSGAFRVGRHDPLRRIAKASPAH